MKRRELLLGAAALTTASGMVAALADGRRGTRSIQSPGPNSSVGPDSAAPLMNMEQAFRVMDEDGIDALVLGDATNFYHASGHRPITATMGFSPNAYVIVSRHREHPLAFVVASFTYYYTLADGLDAAQYPVYLYTGPSGDAPGEAAPVQVFPDRQASPMDAIELRRATLTSLASEEQRAAPGLVPALANALRDVGADKGTIALDLAATREVLGDALPKASFIGASHAMSRIRPVKSAREIALMRQAATANSQAALAAVETVRAGATYSELRGVFAAEAAKRGNRSVFMVIDRVSSDYLDAPFRDGQSFLIDAVSEYRGYHGDYGRTVFVGEPAKPMATATQTIGRAWDEVRHALKPGMRFSDVRALGANTLKKLGGNYIVPFNPHSVGLYHTDHVNQAGIGQYGADLVLQPGMIISVDCPLLEAGMGGSAHLEDLTLITPTGSESINATGDQVIIV